jgi:tetratricopeptide (TPR) repeat protein
MELDDKIYDKIVDLCNEGEGLFSNSLYDKALKKYLKALDLLPLPKEQWDASTWIYSAIGDVYFAKNDYQAASDYFYDAFNCPEGYYNPFILLRLGQSLFEQGDFEKAKEYLLRAYMLEGDEIYEDEEEKYLNLILDIVKAKNSIKEPDALLEEHVEKTATKSVRAELDKALKEQIEKLIEESNMEFDQKNYIKSVDLLQKAWDLIPNPKGRYSESYDIALYSSETYLFMNDIIKAKEWADQIFDCALHRIDSGEREFLSGKIAFEAGELDKAYQFFAVANQKSSGRCFIDEDAKYLKFFKKHQTQK